MGNPLKSVIAEAQARFKADPASAQATFASSSSLQSGLRSEARMRQHSIITDEPENLGGTDAGPNPVELILAALGTCQEITYRAYAAAMDIPLDHVSVKLEGQIDLRGFFGVDDAVRPGYRHIRGTVTLESDASETQLQQLRAAVDAHCPVLDILSQPVPVELGLTIRNADARQRRAVNTVEELTDACPDPA